jgi:predicted RNA-binding protein with PIN domain
VSSTPHLLIDGANILHAWPELRALLLRDRDAARSQLIQRLSAIHDVERVRLTVVFDGRGSELVVERPSGEPSFSILYTPSSATADDVIERLVAQSADPTLCRVATGDQAEVQTVAAAGATTISPDELAAWVRRVEQRQGSRLRQLRDENQGKWPGS